MTNNQLQRLIDERAIEHQLIRIARAMDARDWAALDEVMFADLRLRVP